MRTNVQRSLAMELSTLSMEFRKQQKAYLAKVKQTKEGGAMAADPLDQQGMHTLPPLALTPGAGPLHSLGPHNGEGGAWRLMVRHAPSSRQPPSGNGATRRRTRGCPLDR